MFIFLFYEIIFYDSFDNIFLVSTFILFYTITDITGGGGGIGY